MSDIRKCMLASADVSKSADKCRDCGVVQRSTDATPNYRRRGTNYSHWDFCVAFTPDLFLLGNIGESEHAKCFIASS